MTASGKAELWNFAAKLSLVEIFLASLLVLLGRSPWLLIIMAHFYPLCNYMRSKYRDIHKQEMRQILAGK